MLDTRSLAEHGPVIPVIVIQRLRDAVPMAEALVAGGVRVLEVTLRTRSRSRPWKPWPRCPVPSSVPARCALQDALQCQGRRRQFAVSPGFTESLSDACKAEGLPLLPGVSTASEVMVANDAGYGFLKLFPARGRGRCEPAQGAVGALPRRGLLPHRRHLTGSRRRGFRSCPTSGSVEAPG